MNIPTSWNQIEATLAFYRKMPVLVIAQNGITGGVFDVGVTGQFVLNIDLATKYWHKRKEFQGIYKDWKNRIK